MRIHAIVRTNVDVFFKSSEMDISAADALSSKSRDAMAKLIMGS